ncbi:uncharacterized protein LOC120215551 [Hibiscus syriacus]|uniref:uncharacterized protein LOC120215551 n=1 Tax=Hibiscus syriacus TaxID=106335 RepID=UPI001924B67F|nr:uncharacterized protein LOC120215551 [Hibiscus syriacus]
MVNEVASFYIKLLGTADPLIKEMNPSILQELLNYSFSPEATPSLVKEASADEIKNALFNQGNEKAPGPDEFSSFFFKNCWSIVGEDIINASAFIRGRDIIDNALLAQEIVKGYAILKGLHLPQKFIDWIQICFSQAKYSIAFNGTLIGYFKGARGIRKGDPLSPYLFVLAMNVLSKMLNIAASKGVFAFHPKCKKIGLTHLSFADDLLIFCKGNKDSVAGVLSVLHQFYKVYGLHLNPSKCEIFSAGISPREIENFKIISGFKTGCLPIRYLGIPLVTRKLSLKDCEPLLDKIRQRLHHWSTRNLSYAGRLELIRSVLFSVSNLWCRQLILLATVLKSVDQLWSRFFWKGANKSAAGARVSWDQICQLKSEGGLGLKNTTTWNKACIMSLIRKILAGNGSLWVAWLNSYVFKDQNFWQFNIGSNISWNVKRILKMRNSAFPLFSSGFHQVKEIWGKIRLQGQKVYWHRLVWYPMHLPKHSLISWMAILNRLPTCDRLQRMGLVTAGLCVNCRVFNKSRDHLFSQCPLSIELWKYVIGLNGMNYSAMT